MINVALNIEIIPNDNDNEREDPHGRVHVSHRRTWTLVVNGEFYGEYNTERQTPRPEGRGLSLY